MKLFLLDTFSFFKEQVHLHLYMYICAQIIISNKNYIEKIVAYYIYINLIFFLYMYVFMK